MTSPPPTAAPPVAAEPAAPPASPLWPKILVGAAVGAGVCGLGAFAASKFDVFSGAVADATRGGGETDTPPAARPPADPFAAWTEPPAVAVVLSGEVHGYLEPCGCTEKQNGGVARRSDLFRQLREEKGWEVVAADAGGAVRRGRKQTEFKLTAMRKALAEMGYGALNLGPEELRLGADFLVQQAYDPPPLLSANAVYFGDPLMAGDVGLNRTTVLEAGGVKIGLTGVVGSTMAGELATDGPDALTSVRPAADVLPAALDALADCDVRILLSQAEPDETRQFLKDYPGFHAAVTAGGPEDPDPDPEVVELPGGGSALMLRVGGKGKSVGVLGVYPDARPTGDDGTGDGEADPAGPGLRFALVPLSRDRYGHDARMDVVMAEYQQALADNLGAVFEDIPPTPPPKPGGYVGAAKCGECHTKAYAKWKDTPHAHAYRSLTEGRAEFEGDWADRTRDPECLSCHVTGWNAQEYFPHEGGFLPERLAAAAAGGGFAGDEGLGRGRPVPTVAGPAVRELPRPRVRPHGVLRGVGGGPVRLHAGRGPGGERGHAYRFGERRGDVHQVPRRRQLPALQVRGVLAEGAPPVAGLRG